MVTPTNRPLLGNWCYFGEGSTRKEECLQTCQDLKKKCIYKTEPVVFTTVVLLLIKVCYIEQFTYIKKVRSSSRANQHAIRHTFVSFCLRYNYGQTKLEKNLCMTVVFTISVSKLATYLRPIIQVWISIMVDPTNSLFTFQFSVKIKDGFFITPILSRI